MNVFCRCGKELKVPDEYAGKRVRCPACQQTVDVPNVAVATTVPVASSAKPLSMSAGRSRQVCHEVDYQIVGDDMQMVIVELDPQETVVAEKADLGICLDGDADRVHIIDNNGKLIDGDQIMALIARSWARQGRLRGDGLVTTVMSNLGLERLLEGDGLKTIRTQVGDRYVVEAMRDGNYNVGGEQSGHVVLSDFVTTGDGTITALQVLSEIVHSGRTAAEICHQFDPLPQLLQNVRFQRGQQPLTTDAVKAAISAGEEKLNGSGRLLIRESGTEPVIRVMGEGEDPDAVKAVVGEICDTIEAQVA